MASVHIALAKVARTSMGAVVPIPRAKPRTSVLLDTASASTDAEMEAQAGEVWLVTATGGDVLFKTGTGELDASVAPNLYVVAGIPHAFEAEQIGDRFDVRAVA